MYKKSILLSFITLIPTCQSFSNNSSNQLYVLPNGKIIELTVGNLEDQSVQAVVNPANEHLSHGAGVAGTLANFFPDLQKASDLLPANKPSFYNPSQTVICPVGSACSTNVTLQPKNPTISYVIHAVGPRGNDADRKNLLTHAYIQSLKQADMHDIETIAFPPISIGIFNYPLQEATRIAVSSVANYLVHEESNVKKVVFVIWPGDKRFDEIFSAYQTQLKEI